MGQQLMGQVGKTQLCEASAIRSCFLVTSQVGARGEGAASEVTICDTGQQVKEGRHSLSGDPMKRASTSGNMVSELPGASENSGLSPG